MYGRSDKEIYERHFRRVLNRHRRETHRVKVTHTKGKWSKGKRDGTGGYRNTQHTQTLCYWEKESAGGPVDLPGNIAGPRTGEGPPTATHTPLATQRKHISVT